MTQMFDKIRNQNRARRGIRGCAIVFDGDRGYRACRFDGLVDLDRDRLGGWIVLPFVPDSYQPEALIKRVLGPETEVNIRGLGYFFLFFTTLIGWLAKG